MANTTVVNVDIETAPKLASFLAELKGENKGQFLGDCQNMIQNSQTFDLLVQFLNETEAIVTLDNPKGNTINLVHLMFIQSF